MTNANVTVVPMLMLEKGDPAEKLSEKKYIISIRKRFPKRHQQNSFAILLFKIFVKTRLLIAIDGQKLKLSTL